MAKVSKEQAARNRAHVVDTASHLYREKGLDGIGIADVMRASGLTHGGFYGQFASKDALAAECVSMVAERSLAKWQALVAAAPQDGFAAIVQDYVSARHRDAPENGCALTTLSADAARRGGAIAAAMTEGLGELVNVLTDVVPDKDRQRALAALAQMAGAIMLARAVDDPQLSDDILRAARDALTAANPG
ncbi:TetR/AcrR family transcriptional regulator [soil metagenome]